MKHEFTTAFAHAELSGLNYKVTVTIDYAGEQKDFHAITDNECGVERCQSMEDGQEQYDAFCALIESKIADELEEWQLEIEEAEDRESRELAYEFANDYNPEDKD